MTDILEIELAETLRDLADEIGPVPADLAMGALRDGRRIRIRRTATAALATIVTLAVLAVPAVGLTHHNRSAATTAGSRQHTMDIAVATRGDRSQLSKALQKRFVDAGFTVLSAKPLSTNEIEFLLRSSLPANQMAATIQRLTTPGFMEFRTIVDSTPMPKLTDKQRIVAARVPTTPPTLAGVEAKLGAAYTFAASLTWPAALDSSTKATFAPFAMLTGAEVAVLPAQMQFNVPTINCAQVTGPTIAARAGQQIVACEQPGGSIVPTKDLLSAAQLTNADIATATPVKDQGLGWTVTVNFTAAGQALWTDLTTQLTASADPGNGIYKQVAIMMDGKVLMAPNIESPLTGPAIITGDGPSLTRTSATALATVINDGPLPSQPTGEIIGAAK